MYLDNKSIQEIDENIAAVSQRLTVLNIELNMLMAARAQTAKELVNEFLPALTHKVFIRLRRCFPTFLTPARKDAFLFNKIRFGFFKPKNYQTVLSLLQAHFLKHLEHTGMLHGEHYLITSHTLLKNKTSSILKKLCQERKYLLEKNEIEVIEIDGVEDPGLEV